MVSLKIKQALQIGTEAEGRIQNMKVATSTGDWLNIQCILNCSTGSHINAHLYFSVVKAMRF